MWNSHLSLARSTTRIRKGSAISSFGAVLNKPSTAPRLESNRHYLLCGGGPLDQPHQGARCTSVIPSVDLNPFSFTFVIALTDVKTRSTFIIFRLHSLGDVGCSRSNIRHSVGSRRGCPRSVNTARSPVCSKRHLTHDPCARCTTGSGSDGYRWFCTLNLIVLMFDSMIASSPNLHDQDPIYQLNVERRSSMFQSKARWGWPQR